LCERYPRQDLTAEINKALEAHGYRVITATVEKVPVGGLREVSVYQGRMASGKVLFDAMVWFRLEKN
jgi:hypothetical protein